MSVSLPAPIEAYFAAVNAHDPDRAVACFAPAAVVADDGHTRIGLDSIRAWIKGAIAQYRMTSDVISTEQTATATKVSANVSGTFPGSPITFHYTFTTVGDHISTLLIRT